ncbi:MAG: FAD-dependent oxidoreductase [Verrucomicrobiales bacterium]|nr:FAD-dependent oxidoreductase [Verrucomicrobiales bacterium]
MKRILLLGTTLFMIGLQSDLHSETILVEAESFEQRGGWKLDTQFIDIMGSPYLLAHGLGNPVADASTKVSFSKTGDYRIWVRTLDWVARWKAEGTPGKFQVLINGKAVDQTFGTTSADWHWQDGGMVTISNKNTTLSLHDLTGFNGRCDAILFSDDPDFIPDNTSEVLPKWRRELMGKSAEIIDEKPFDIVFIGGGYAGSCGAIAAARMGLNVALVQDRSVLGGNGSSEVQVWAQGNTPAGLYPIGDIIREFEDHAKASPGTIEEYEDAKKDKIARTEKNLTLFLNHHAYKVEMKDKEHIDAILALDTRSNEVRRIKARFFCDSTGHGSIGQWAGADIQAQAKGRMGMSNMWTWSNADQPQTFSSVPWALDLSEEEFPYPRKFHAQWFWESGFDKDPIKDLEAIRDWNFRAAYGAFNALKNKAAYARNDPDKKDHKNARLTWMAYIGGPRETQQLLGDVILTEEDLVTKKPFPDGCVLTTWGIDLHYPQERYMKKYADNPFISRAEFGEGVDKRRGYPVPYRCFYSRNINNLFMAGRNVSVTHKALGTVRVMKTGGMMGVVVGKAAAIGTQYNCSPREVYSKYLDKLIVLLQQPGYIRRDSLSDEFRDDPTLPHLSAPPADFIQKSSLSGIVIDDREAKLTGKWTEGEGLKNYVDHGYHYASKSGKAEAKYQFKVPQSGNYEVRISWQPHANRSSKTPITVISADGEKTTRVNQKIAPPLAKGFATLGVYSFKKDQTAAVIITNDDVDGNVHIDAVQILLEK